MNSATREGRENIFFPRMNIPSGSAADKHMKGSAKLVGECTRMKKKGLEQIGEAGGLRG